MKKKIILITMLATLLLPLTTFAKELKYESENFKETLKSENIEQKFKDYKENDSQVTIYMFRGSGCTYCNAFLEYLNSIVDEYGKYFKLVSYEVWSNSNNASLYSEVAEFVDKEAKGVPFIVIGDQAFEGYSEEYNERIIKTIKDEYAAKDKYDIMKELEKEKKWQSIKNFFNSGIFAIICNIIITATLTIVIILLTNSKNQKLAKRIEQLEKELAKYKDSHNKEENNSKPHKEHKDKKKHDDKSEK